jgi:methylmalonyl-CoA/ethylmalonyl-CoA epimerase
MSAMASSKFDDQVIFQVAFVTNDIETTKKWCADFFEMPVPETNVTSGYKDTGAEYLGAPSEARAKLAFFRFGNTTLELIEPDDQPSCWREFLDRNGPGFHHLAFKVAGMKEKVARFEKLGNPLLQKGEFTGGRYAYVDTEPQLGALIELLEFDRD